MSMLLDEFENKILKLPTVKIRSLY